MFMGSVSNSRPTRLVLATVIALTTSLAASGTASGAPTPSHSTKLLPRTLPIKSLMASIGTGRDSRMLVVKLRDDAGATTKEGRLVVPDGPLTAKRLDTLAVEQVLATAPDATVRPLFTVGREILDHLRRMGEQNTGRALADLTQFFLVRNADSGRAEQLLRDVLRLDGVENAYAVRAPRVAADIGTPTPDFLTLSPGQGYRNPAPEGIGIDVAWARGFTGTGITVTDVEFNWNLRHEDLCPLTGQSPAVDALVPQSEWLDPALPMTTNINHGTATLGVLAAGDNGFGTSGLVPNATVQVVPAMRNGMPSWNAPNALVAATLSMRRGDVLLVELQDGNFIPLESFDAEFAAVRQATALGIHVIEPAGNGGTDLNALDVPGGSGFLPFDLAVRDSGAVLIGASNPVAPNGACSAPSFSNFGDRVDSFSWGRNVTTLGYGPNSFICPLTMPTTPDAFPAASGPDEWYTHCYAGTSSAGAIVAGAATILSEMYTARYRGPFPTREMRNMMRLGTACSANIGRQPDLRYYFNFLSRGGVIPHRFKAELTANPGAGQEFGAAVAGAGDIDGDGTPDVVVGVPSFSPQPTQGNSEGRAIVYSGATGTVLYRFDGVLPGDRFGAAVAGGSDVDGDGVPDIAIGAPGDDSGDLTDSGSVRVISGATGLALFTVNGPLTQGESGFSVALPGDIDGDGFGELLVGAPGQSFSTVGRARLYAGPNGILRRTVGVAQIGSELGFAVAGAGDTNGDGVLDFIVGAPNMNTNNGIATGAAFIYSGAGGTIRGLPGEASNSRFGAAVASAGDVDVNPDGQAEVVVGAPGLNISSQLGSAGRTYVYNAGGGLRASFDGQRGGDHLGTSVAGVGDFNGDGIPDIALGQPSFLGSPGQNNFRPGRVFVFHGPFPQPDLPIGQRRRVFWTPDTSTLFGVAVAAVGDINGDGLDDVIAGEPKGAGDGQAWVFALSSPVVGDGPRLIADFGAIEVDDTDGDGYGGSVTPTVSLAPAASGLFVDAPVWKGASYRIVGMPSPPFDQDPVAQMLVRPAGAPVSPGFLFNRSGTLDANGQATMPAFGPIPASLLTGLVGAEFRFLALLEGDIDGDGIIDRTRTTTAIVTVIDE